MQIAGREDWRIDTEIEQLKQQLAAMSLPKAEK
jgi:hypothetical protein